MWPEWSARATLTTESTGLSSGGNGLTGRSTVASGVYGASTAGWGVLGSSQAAGAGVCWVRIRV